MGEVLLWFVEESKRSLDGRQKRSTHLWVRVSFQSNSPSLLDCLRRLKNTNRNGMDECAVSVALRWVLHVLGLLVTAFIVKGCGWGVVADVIQTKSYVERCEILYKI